jgi:mannose-1-phosphate guanylyltransferase
MASGVRNVLGDGSGFDMRVRYAEEPRPLGTAGAVKFAEPLLDDRFVALNGDILTDFDLSAQIEQHVSTGARATIAVIPVEDPSAYGLVRVAADTRVQEYLEKPSADQIDTNLINAGAYVLEREILSSIPDAEYVSIERDVFPSLVDAGLHGFAANGYWLDIGTPQRYLQGTFDILERNVDTRVGELLNPSFMVIGDSAEVRGRMVPPAVVEAGSIIAEGARVGSLAVLGQDVKVGAGSIVERAVVLNGADIGPRCVVRDCIVGAGVRLGRGTHIEGGAVLGEGVTVGADNLITAGARIFPGVTLPDGAIRF